MKKYIKPLFGDFTGQKVWVVRHDDGLFGWEYTFEGDACGPSSFQTQEEAEKHFKYREHLLSFGGSVLW